MTNRRDFLIGSSAAIVGLGTKASPIRSMIGGYGSSNSGIGGDISNPYVTDGLVGMWDGEWNAGLGKHDNSFIGLKDLSGNRQHITSVNMYNGSLLVGDNWFRGSEDLTRAEIPACDALRGYDPTVDCLTIEINFHDMYPHFQNEAIISIGALRYDYPNVFTARWGEGASSGTSQYKGRLYFGEGTGQITSPNAPANYNRITIVKMQNTYGETANTSELKLYYNGAYRNTYSASGKYSWGVYKTISHIQLFNWFKKTGSPTSGVKYRNIMIYNRALTPEEITFNYEIDKERFGLE